MEAARTKKGADQLAVCHRRSGSISIVLLMALVRHLLPGDFLPKHLSSLAVEAKNEKLVFLGGNVRNGSRRALRSHWHGSQHEHSIPPDDGCRLSVAGQSGFPLHVLRLAPLQRR